MILEHSADEADIHRDTYIAMLRSALHQRGDKALFAMQTGIVSREFLSYVIGARGTRSLSPRKAKEIAACLPWPQEVQDKFVEHVQLHREARLRRLEVAMIAIRDYSPMERLNHLRRLFASITSGVKVEEMRLKYLAIRDDCMDLLRTMPPKRSPLEFVEVCLILCDIQCVLDRTDEALFYSKIASNILECQDAENFRSERARYDDLVILALRAQASAYHSMDLPNKSYDTCREALDKFQQTRVKPLESKVHLYVTQIRALSNTPRFSIREARHLADKAYKVSERLASEQDYQTQRLNIQRALGTAETQYGNARRAGILLQPLVEQGVALPGVRLVLRTGVMRSYAQQQFAIGDKQGGTTTLKAALRLAWDAGLTHQIRQNRRLFGPIVDTLLLELAATRW